MSVKFSELPPELKELIKIRTIEQFGISSKKYEQEVEKDSEPTFFFEWSVTPERDVFWGDVHYGRDLEKHNEYARTIVGNLSANYEIY